MRLTTKKTQMLYADKMTKNQTWKINNSWGIFRVIFVNFLSNLRVMSNCWLFIKTKVILFGLGLDCECRYCIYHFFVFSSDDSGSLCNLNEKVFWSFFFHILLVDY